MNALELQRRGDDDFCQSPRSVPALDGRVSRIQHKTRQETGHPLPPRPLCNDILARAVDQACVSFNKQSSPWTFQRHGNGGGAQGSASLWFVHASKRNESKYSTTTSASKNTRDQFTTSFSIAYSTWDGRILYVDEWDTEAHTSIKNGVPRVISPVLASIALQLHCTRILWQHIEDASEFLETPTVEPELLQGWLTLFWYPDSFRNFYDPSLLQTEAASTNGALARLHRTQREGSDRSPFSIQKSIQLSLGPLNKRSNKNRFRVRLARSNGNPDANAQDLRDICRLVQGSADYGNDPDAINVGSAHYQLDGDSLFFCLLLQQEQNAIYSKDSEEMQYRTCGMAFCYLGQRHEDNRITADSDASDKPRLFLYLEDLFIEPQHRKCGGGVLLMQSLAAIAIALDCSLIQWQALDWNTPALSFYQNKLGAVIQTGLYTSHYMGVEALEAIANSSGVSAS
jgi:GNAT superfamily N-acetyltransferase